MGFRPFVYRLATRYGLSGFVLNDQDGVLVEVEGPSLEPFLSALRREKPPLARIDRLELTHLDRRGERVFTIRPSEGAGNGGTRLVPDAATCAACLEELFDPESRFYHYPFATCTDCGPRFTIVRKLPYDRPNTSMADFELCGACAADYANPGGRRFHAEAIACPACGPRLSHELEAVAAALRRGQVVALKGIGGFHLFCDARNEEAVVTLRQRKRRPRRPFAVMVANSASLDLIAFPAPAERDLVGDAARAIVLMRAGAALAPSIAPGLGLVGVMLPLAPIHQLLFHALAGYPEGRGWLESPVDVALVATSGNIAGRPLVIDNEEAAELNEVADLIVTHDRVILARADDSLMAVIDGAPAFIRRSRGYAPEPIDLGEDGPTVLAVGGHMKATICVTRGREAFLSPHVGDLDTGPTVRVYEETVRRMVALLGVAPAMVACDQHPDYRSTRFAEGLGLPLFRVQHHVAHLAAVAAEHRLGGALVGAALDGHGHGDDGSGWGGELMRREGGTWRRIGHLRPVAAPGGDRAARDPWRMGVAILSALGRGDEAAARFAGIDAAGRVAAALGSDLKCPSTTSLGRLFDAAAALLGVCTRQTYEAEAAMAMESLVDLPLVLDDGYAIEDGVLDFWPLFRALLQPGLGRAEGAALFHGTLIAGLADWIDQGVERRSGCDVVLGGGCLANRVLAGGLAGALRSRGLVPWLPRLAPANDGGLALGQAALARAHLAAARGLSRPAGS